MAPSAKRITTVLESSNNFKNDERLRYALTQDRPTTGVVPPIGPETTNKPEKKKISKRNKIIAGIAGTALIVGAGVVGLNNLTSGEKPAEVPSNSGPQNPGTGEEEPSGETDGLWYETLNVNPTAEDVVLSAENITPEELPEAFLTDTVTTWFNAGYSLEFADSLYEGDSTEFKSNVDAHTAEYDEVIKDTVVSGDLDAKTAAYVDKIEKIHADNIFFASRTSYPEMSRADIEPYMRGSKLIDYTDLEVAENGTVSFTANFEEYDNADLNSVGEDISNGTKVEDGTSSATFEFVLEDGNYKLSRIK